MGHKKLAGGGVGGQDDIDAENYEILHCVFYTCLLSHYLQWYHIE